jgi:ribonuclease HI/probable phosphoglycerate mutase
VYLDSKLVVEQLNGNWKIKQLHLREAVDEIRAMMEKLDVEWQIEHVRREKNSWSDMLVNKALDAAGK